MIFFCQVLIRITLQIDRFSVFRRISHPANPLKFLWCIFFFLTLIAILLGLRDIGFTGGDVGTASGPGGLPPSAP